jgi:hypothetical protein
LIFAEALLQQGVKRIKPSQLDELVDDALQARVPRHPNPHIDVAGNEEMDKKLLVHGHKADKWEPNGTSTSAAEIPLTQTALEAYMARGEWERGLGIAGHR